MLWGYIDLALGRNGYFVHTYFLTPVLPIATNITASVLPVGFLLLYQYCTNHNKNFYLSTLLLSAIFAFGFAGIERFLGLVEFRKGMNHFYLYLIDLGIVFITYWFTKLILRLRDVVRP
jgi:undecaprenyl pyrophosphate phosphatase UppP